MSDGLATPSPVAYVVPATRIGLPPPTLSSMAGCIHPLVAEIHGWCDSGWSAPDGGVGAIVTVDAGDATPTSPCWPVNRTDAVRAEPPVVAPAGIVTANTASA